MDQKNNTTTTIMNHPARLLGVREVADLAGVSTKTIRRYHNAGLLPNPTRLAGRTLLKWRQGDIVAWINGQVEN